ncbi:hypothetical protein HW130_15545 [Streptomyces sp. PKU-EA00015]|uniref:hypothetical protein n=1 Tax=Streptomyces sp. PKU-EA00015 TaxID=2748326 RepID=UPI0015A1B536|nr:hypothetical protein [Streptomyces sp. PKU-EA00015]NWF27660.1 hypothetical protein [Streptomyces sp. PKU-EA00015]
MSEPSNHPRWHAAVPPQPPVSKRRKWPWVVLVVLVLVVGGCLAAVGLVVSEVSDEDAVDRTATVTYEVTGDARDVTVSFSVQGTGDLRTEQELEQVTDLPWRREIKTSGQEMSSTLVVTVGADGGKATCRVRVDDRPVRTATASGPGDTATCKAP